MILKAEGIVLKSVRFDDHNLISTIFTLEFGLKSFIIPGAFSSRGKNKQVYFHILSNIEFVFYENPNRELQKITEVNFKSVFKSIHTHPIKTAYSYLISEIFIKSTQDPNPNEEVYFFLKSYILVLDEDDSNLFHYTVAFLALLTEYLGFFPLNEVTEVNQNIYFDLEKGVFTNSAVFIGSSNNICYHFFFLNTVYDAGTISFPKENRMEVLSMILNYYRTHLISFTEIKSLSMLEEIFR